MFAYEESLETYINSRRKKVIDRNIERIQNIRSLVGTFGQSSLVKELTIKYVDALERCSNEIYERPESTISFISNLRFLFETCITVRLLKAEVNYKYKVRYSIYKHQLDKSQSLKEYANVDLLRLADLEIEESGFGYNNKMSPEEITDSFKKVDALYDNLEEEIALFLDNANFNGAGFHKTYITSFIDKNNAREKKYLMSGKKLKKIY